MNIFVVVNESAFPRLSNIRTYHLRKEAQSYVDEQLSAFRDIYSDPEFSHRESLNCINVYIPSDPEFFTRRKYGIYQSRLRDLSPLEQLANVAEGYADGS